MQHANLTPDEQLNSLMHETFSMSTYRELQTFKNNSVFWPTLYMQIYAYSDIFRNTPSITSEGAANVRINRPTETRGLSASEKNAYLMGNFGAVSR